MNYGIDMRTRKCVSHRCTRDVERGGDDRVQVPNRRRRIIDHRQGAADHAPAYDGSKQKLPALAARTSGEPHPYVVGAKSIGRYLTVARECAMAALAEVE